MDDDDYDRVEFDFDFDSQTQHQTYPQTYPQTPFGFDEDQEFSYDEESPFEFQNQNELHLSPAYQLALESLRCVDLSSETQSEYNLLNFLSTDPNNIVIQVRDVPSFTDPNDRYVQVPFSMTHIEGLNPRLVERNARIICARRLPFRIFSSREVLEINKPVIDENLKTYRHFMLNFRGGDEYLLADDESQYKYYRPENRFFVIQNYHVLSDNERRFWEGINMARTGRPLNPQAKFIRNETLVNRRTETYFVIEGYTIEDYLSMS